MEDKWFFLVSGACITVLLELIILTILGIYFKIR